MKGSQFLKLKKKNEEMPFTAKVSNNLKNNLSENVFEFDFAYTYHISGRSDCN